MDTRLALVVSAGDTAAFEKAAATLSGLSLHWVVYERESDIGKQVRRLLTTQHVDALALGPLPYDCCRDMLPPDLPVAITRPGPVELAITYAKALADGWSLTPVSIDTFGEPTVRDVSQELNIPQVRIRCLPYASGQSGDAIVAFHRESLAQLGSGYVITCRSAAARALSGKIPLQHVSVTPSTIRAALHEVVLRTQSRRKGDLQFAAGVFTLKAGGAAGDLDRDRTALKYALLKAPAFADAWVEERGRRNVAVLAHKALLEKATHGWTAAPAVDNGRSDVGQRLAVGFGLGPSARKCVSLAEQAAAQAEQVGDGCAYLVTDDGLIIGPMGGAAPPLSYTYREHGQSLEALARKVGLSAVTLSRLAAVDRRLATQPISAAELAETLGITSPSGRRLLRTLVAHELATRAGTTQSSRRGRPLHLYRLRVNKKLLTGSNERPEDANGGGRHPRPSGATTTNSAGDSDERSARSRQPGQATRSRRRS